MDSTGLVRGLRTQVADRLREDILSGRLKPGEKLAETHLVKRFGVSRAPVREALVQLTQEGLLVSQANRGVRVTGPASDELLEVFLPIRCMLEAYALKACYSKLGDDQYRKWMEILARMKDGCHQRDFAVTAEADIAFHRLLIEFAGEPDLIQIWSSLVGRLRIYFQNGHMAYTRPLDIYREHRDLFDVFRGGDLDKALAAAQKHGVSTASDVEDRWNIIDAAAAN
jgi:DNA-binding GntR family transcriptional regulator